MCASKREVPRLGGAYVATTVEAKRRKNRRRRSKGWKRTHEAHDGIKVMKMASEKNRNTKSLEISHDSWSFKIAAIYMK